MSLKNKKVLITCGPTCVPVDCMRVLSNRSTGLLAQTIAKDFVKRGAKVTLLEGAVEKPCTSKSIKVFKYFFFQELLDLLKKELSKKKYDIIVHAAAVSDYRLNKSSKTKIRSGIKQLKLTLIPTPKIINRIKKISPKSFLVGFKLESSSSKKILKAKAVSLIKQAGCDLVVANSLTKGYQGHLVNRDGNILATARSKKGLSQKLLTTLDLEL